MLQPQQRRSSVPWASLRRDYKSARHVRMDGTKKRIGSRPRCRERNARAARPRTARDRRNAGDRQVMRHESVLVVQGHRHTRACPRADQPVVNRSPEAVIVAETGPDDAGGGPSGPGRGLFGPGCPTGGPGGAGGGGSGVGGSGVGSGVGGSGVAVGGAGVAVGASVAVATGAVAVTSGRAVELADGALSLSPLHAMARAREGRPRGRIASSCPFEANKSVA